MEKLAKTNVSYMRIWHYEPSKTKAKMCYEMPKKNHVSRFLGAAVERLIQFFLTRMRNEVQLSSNPHTSL